MKPVLLLSICVLWLLSSSCSKQKEAVAIEVASPIDSIAFHKRIIVERAWYNNFSERMELSTKDSVYVVRPDNKKLALSEFNHISTKQLHQFSKNIFLNDYDWPYTLNTLQTDTFLKRKISYFQGMKGSYYAMQLIGHNSYLIRSDNSILVNILYEPKNYNESLDSIKTYQNKSRVGRYRPSGDTLLLDTILNVHPRKNFLIGDTRYLSLRRYIVNGDHSFYNAYNFIDTLYEVNYTGSIKRSIPLPESINFQYFNYDQSEINTQYRSEYARSKYDGHKVSGLWYNPKSSCLMVRISEYLTGATDSFTPGYDDLTWYLAIYDTKKNIWTKVLKFGSDHNKRYVFMDSHHIYVSRFPDHPFIYDIYEYD